MTLCLTVRDIRIFGNKDICLLHSSFRDIYPLQRADLTRV